MTRFISAFAVACLAASAVAVAQGENGWLAVRQRDFTAWQTAHPGVETRLTALKEKTAALVAAHVPAATTGGKYADLKAQSTGLSAVQRATAQRYFASGYQFLELQDDFSAREFLDLGLAIDPANVKAILHRADIYRRSAETATDPYFREGYRALAGLFMDRVLMLAPGTDDARTAATALQSLPKVTEETDVNLPTVLWRVPGAPTELWDTPFAPPMVIIPAGEYTMGSRATENKMEINRSDLEIPRHRVRIRYPLGVSKYLVTRGEFAYFLADSGYNITSTVCGVPDSGLSWNKVSFPQTDNHPAVCMSYNSANAYVDWLSRKTGHTYRLLSESEWEFAARGGTTTAYYWGDALGKGNANCPSCGSQWDDKGTSPVGSFPPNPFGLYDMAGNVWQIVGDCFNYTYAGAPADGSAWRAGNCANSLERGGSFNQSSFAVRVAGHRGGRADVVERGLSIHGFRVARVL